jgi:hypothetical protein
MKTWMGVLFVFSGTSLLAGVTFIAVSASRDDLNRVSPAFFGATFLVLSVASALVAAKVGFTLERRGERPVPGSQERH